MKNPALMILCQSGVWNKRWQQEFFNPTEKHMLFVLKILCYKYWLVSNVGVMYYCCQRACEGYYC